MFFQTDGGRLQNLFLLQDVRVVENEDKTYSIGYVQINGEVLKEGSYSKIEEADTALSLVVQKLV